MKKLIVTCDNCNCRARPLRRRPTLAGKPVDLCDRCLVGKPPVNVQAPLDEWPVLIRSRSVKPLLEELARLREFAAGTGTLDAGLLDRARRHTTKQAEDRDRGRASAVA